MTPLSYKTSWSYKVWLVACQPCKFVSPAKSVIRIGWPSLLTSSWLKVTVSPRPINSIGASVNCYDCNCKVEAFATTFHNDREFKWIVNGIIDLINSFSINISTITWCPLSELIISIISAFVFFILIPGISHFFFS